MSVLLLIFMSGQRPSMSGWVLCRICVYATRNSFIGGIWQCSLSAAALSGGVRLLVRQCWQTCRGTLQAAVA
jgi:hypothetical protein